MYSAYIYIYIYIYICKSTLPCYISGNMRICKSKADLKRCTKVETSRTGNTNCTVLDGCAIMWCIAWPLSSQALVRDYVESFKNYLRNFFHLGDVYLMFDRYIAYSTKCSAHKARAPDGSRIYKLSANSLLPSQKHTLTNTDNKKQLIQIIIEILVSEAVIPGSYVPEQTYYYRSEIYTN